MATSYLLVNLAFALGVGLVGAILVTRLGQSVIVGYILAGVAIGPFTPGFVGDVSAVEALADVGVIFLMFAIGVQLSFRELMSVGRVAIVGGGVQVIIMIGVGYLVGLGLGWQPLEALFFGAVISNSSSTVLTKVLGERGEVDSTHGRIALAWSTVQDFGTVALIVILSALAMGSGNLLTDLSVAVARSALFLVLIFVLGSRALPWVFERVATLRNREIFIITVVATALGTAYLSTYFGLSVALGAFAAGVVVGESDLSLQILGDITPLRDIFAAVFFISVGMLINPVFVFQNLGLVLVTLMLIVIVKGALSAVITGVAGYPVTTAIFTGVALAQSAEFSFLLARVGVSVGGISSSTFSLMLAAAAISIVVLPSNYRCAGPMARWLERRLAPSKLSNPPHVNNPEAQPRGHAVICGYGRVGGVIGTTLRRRGFSILAIEQNHRLVNRLREQGVTALLGNAANPILLDHANLPRARVLVVAIPDALAAQQIVEYSRRVNPRLNIVVRAHSDRELAFMHSRGVDQVVMGEVELALEMTRHTLRRFGISLVESQAIVQGLRERVSAKAGLVSSEIQSE